MSGWKAPSLDWIPFTKDLIPPSSFQKYYFLPYPLNLFLTLHLMEPLESYNMNLTQIAVFTTRLVHPLLFSLEPWQVQRRTIPEKETDMKTKRNSCKHPHNCAVKPKQPHSATVLLKHCHGLHYSGKQKATRKEKHSSVLGLNTLSCLWNLKPRFFFGNIMNVSG